MSKRTAGSPGTLEPARRRQGRLEAAAIEPERGGRRRKGSARRGRWRRAPANSGGGKVQLGEPELMASMACSGVAGADGEERGTAAEDVGHGSRLGFGLDPEKRGSGVGEREIE